MFCFSRKKTFNVSNAEVDVERGLREEEGSVTGIALQPLLYSAPELRLPHLSLRIREAIEMRNLPAVVDLLAASDLLASDWDETPLHMCIFYYCEMTEGETITAIEMDIMNAILDKHPGILDHVDRSGSTALHRAIQSGHLEVVRALLDSGATSHIGEITALHVAVKHPHILKFFLNTNDVKNTPNHTVRALIHNAAVYDKVESVELLVEKFGKEQLTWTCNSATLLHVAAQNGSVAVAKYLLFSPQYNHRSIISLKDSNGKTPLYLAAEQGHEEMTALLLKNGAFLSEEKKKGRTVVKQIKRKFSEPDTFLECVFDEFVYEKTDCRGQVKLCVDFSVLTGNDGNGTGQMKVLQDLVICGLRKLLLHPVSRSLLYLKMKLLLPVFYMIIVINAMFLLAFNTYIFRFYRRGESSATCTYISFEYKIVMAVLYCTTCLLLMQDCIIIHAQGRRYFASLEYYVPLLGYPTLFLVLSMETIGSSCAIRISLEHDIAFAALVLFWLRAWMLLARLPYCGQTIFIFAKCANYVFKFFVSAGCLIFVLTIDITIFYYTPETDDNQDPVTELLGKFPNTFENIKNSLGLTNEHMGPSYLESTIALLCIAIITSVISTAMLWVNFTIHDIHRDFGKVAGGVGSLEHHLDLLCSLDLLIRLALGKIYKNLLMRRRHYCKIENYPHSDKIWKVSCSIGDHLARPYAYNDTLNIGIVKPIIKIIRNSEQDNEKKEAKKEKRDKFNALHDAVVGSTINKCYIAKTEDKIEPAVTMRDMINILEIETNDNKKSIDDIKESIGDIKEYIDDMNMCVKMLLIQSNQQGSPKRLKRSHTMQ